MDKMLNFNVNSYTLQFSIIKYHELLFYFYFTMTRDFPS